MHRINGTSYMFTNLVHSYNFECVWYRVFLSACGVSWWLLLVSSEQAYMIIIVSYACNIDRNTNCIHIIDIDSIITCIDTVIIKYTHQLGALVSILSDWV